MEDKKLSNEELKGILTMLEMKKRFLASLEDNLKAINEIVPLVKSCVKDYEIQIEQVKGMIEPEKPAESQKA